MTVDNVYDSNGKAVELAENGVNSITFRTLVDADHVHEYGEWEVCDAENHKRVCVCGEEITEAHIWDDGVITKAPTYFNDGLMTYTCTECGYKKTEVIEKLPATEDDTTVTVGDVDALSGKEVIVPISISNNVGLAGLHLVCEYDADVFTLIEASAGKALGTMEFTVTEDLTNPPINLLWDALEADNSNGEIALLKFRVADDAALGEYTISIRAKSAYDNDINKVPVLTKNGTVTVSEYIMGDPNGDGGVDIKDVLSIRRYLVGIMGIMQYVAAADVNKDGKVSIKDVVMMRRFIVGGYGVILK